MIEEKKEYIERVVTYLNDKFPNIVSKKQIAFLNHNFLDSDGKYYNMSYERFKSEMSHFAKSLMDKRIKELEESEENDEIITTNEEVVEDKASKVIEKLKEEEKSKENPFVIAFLSFIILGLSFGIGFFVFKVM